MYLRTVRRRNKRGDEVRYLQVVESHRSSPGRSPRTKVLLNLGREDQLDRRALSKLVGEVAKAAGLGPHRVETEEDAFTVVSVEHDLLEYVVQRLLERAGIIPRSPGQPFSSDGVVAAVSTTLRSLVYGGTFVVQGPLGALEQWEDAPWSSAHVADAAWEAAREADRVWSVLTCLEHQARPIGGWKGRAPGRDEKHGCGGWAVVLMDGAGRPLGISWLGGRSVAPVALLDEADRACAAHGVRPRRLIGRCDELGEVPGDLVAVGADVDELGRRGRYSGALEGVRFKRVEVDEVSKVLVSEGDSGGGLDPCRICRARRAWDRGERSTRSCLLHDLSGRMAPETMVSLCRQAAQWSGWWAEMVTSSSAVFREPSAAFGDLVLWVGGAMERQVGSKLPTVVDALSEVHAVALQVSGRQERRWTIPEPNTVQMVERMGIFLDG